MFKISYLELLFIVVQSLILAAFPVLISLKQSHAPLVQMVGSQSTISPPICLHFPILFTTYFPWKTCDQINTSRAYYLTNSHKTAYTFILSIVIQSPVDHFLQNPPLLWLKDLLQGSTYMLVKLGLLIGSQKPDYMEFMALHLHSCLIGNGQICNPNRII